MKPQTFALMTGAVVGGTGLAGMISPLRKPMVENIKKMKLDKGYSKIAGVVPTNDLFNFLRLGIGITGILASRKRESAVIFNRMIAGNYALMAVMGVLPQTKTMFGLLPIFGGNVWLHGVTAAGELLAEEDLMVKARNVLPFKDKNVRRGAVTHLSPGTSVGGVSSVRVGELSVSDEPYTPVNSGTFGSLNSASI